MKKNQIRSLFSKEKFSAFFALIWNGLKHAVLHNLGFKIIALLISVVLWAGLISQDTTLTRDKTFRNVNVSVNGSETMKRNGYIVTSNLDNLLADVSIVAEVPQQQYEKAEASTYNLRVDLSRINGTGTQELKILSTASNVYGRVVDTSPESIQVEVEDYIVRQRIPVSASLSGEVPEGWYISTLGSDPILVAVSGPKSLVQTISRARVFLDAATVDWAEGAIFDSADILLYNRSGEQVNSDQLSITSESMVIDSVLIDATILPTKTFNVDELIQYTGTPAEGYEVTGVKLSPETVTVAARSEVLDKLAEAPMERNVNITDLSETTVFQLKLQKPSDDAVLVNDTVIVTVEIDQIREPGIEEEAEDAGVTDQPAESIEPAESNVPEEEKGNTE